MSKPLLTEFGIHQRWESCVPEEIYYFTHICNDKECKLFHVKKAKSPKPKDEKSDRAAAPHVARDSNGNMKGPAPPPPSTPPPTPKQNPEAIDALKIMNSDSFLDKLVDQLVLRLDTRKKEQERKEKVGIILSQLN